MDHVADYDTTTNTPGLFWSFTADSVLFSPDMLTWDVIGGYTFVPNTYRMVDDPIAGCANANDTGVYTATFLADTVMAHIE